MARHVRDEYKHGLRKGERKFVDDATGFVISESQTVVGEGGVITEEAEFDEKYVPPKLPKRKKPLQNARIFDYNNLKLVKDADLIWNDKTKEWEHPEE